MVTTVYVGQSVIPKTREQLLADGHVEGEWGDFPDILCGYMKHMLDQYSGKILTVRRVLGHGRYKLDGDDNWYTWSSEMLNYAVVTTPCGNTLPLF